MSTITQFEEARRLGEQISNFMKRLSESQYVFQTAIEATRYVDTLRATHAETEAQCAALAATRLDLEQDIARLKRDKQALVDQIAADGATALAARQAELETSLEALEAALTLAQQAQDLREREHQARLHDLQAEEERLAILCNKHQQTLGRIKKQVASLVDEEG